MKKTAAFLNDSAALSKVRRHARNNLSLLSKKFESTPVVRIVEGDWGEVTSQLTKEFGTRFVVLNMANGTRFGGGYLHGSAAQEENMFRRTDCSLMDSGVSGGNYSQAMSDLINGKNGRVYIDAVNPRVCFRGREDPNESDLGYRFLRDDEVFEFYEMRAAAVDLRKSFRTFDRTECERRIKAQFAPLLTQKKTPVVLSAFGCGAFLNPTDTVAEIYRDLLRTTYAHLFQVVVFAVHNAGYGPDNFKVFKEVFSRSPILPRTPLVLPTSLFKKMTVANFNILGLGPWNKPDPYFQETDVLTDPAGLPFISANDPGGAGAASQAIYKKLGVTSFPAHVRSKVTKTSDAALATYGRTEVIHVVGPDGRTFQCHNETTFFDALVAAYTHVFNEFGKSKMHHLRLLPVSGGVFSGVHNAAIPRITLAAIKAALERTTATAKLQKPETTYRLCVLGKYHNYLALLQQ